MEAGIQMVWRLRESLRSYRKIINHFQQENRFEMELVDPETGKVYLYGYNFSMQMLTVCNKERSSFAAVCPYEGCSRPSGNGYICTHLRAEMFEETATSKEDGCGIFRQGGVSSDGIRLVLEEIGRARGLKTVGSVSEQKRLLESIRSFPFIWPKYNVIASCNPHSRSINLDSINGSDSAVTCAIFGCLSPACMKYGLHMYCLKHYSSAEFGFKTKHVNKELRTDVLKDIYRHLKGQAPPILTSRELAMIYKHLWKLGSYGYLFEDGRRQIVVIMDEGRRIFMKSYLNASSTVLKLCPQPDCYAETAKKEVEEEKEEGMKKKEKGSKAGNVKAGRGKTEASNVKKRTSIDEFPVFCEKHQTNPDSLVFTATENLIYGSSAPISVLNSNAIVKYLKTNSVFSE